MWVRILKISKPALLGVAFAMCLGLSQAGTARPAASQSASTKDAVYVCACMGNKSCPCMSMAKNAGKCTCGKEMKKVALNSAWAKHNRQELSK